MGHPPNYLGLKRLNPPQLVPLKKIVTVNFNKSILIPKFLKIKQKLSSCDFLKNIPHENDKKSIL